MCISRTRAYLHPERRGTRSPACSPCGHPRPARSPSAPPAASSARSPTSNHRDSSLRSASLPALPTPLVTTQHMQPSAGIASSDIMVSPSRPCQQRTPDARRARGPPSPWPAAAARARSPAPCAAALRAAPQSAPPPLHSCAARGTQSLRRPQPCPYLMADSTACNLDRRQKALPGLTQERHCCSLSQC